MRIHQLSETEALASLGSAASGLCSAEAHRRLDEFGPNRVEELRREAPLLRLLREFVHFFALILWVAAALAFFADWSAPGEGMATLGWAIVVVIVVSGVFSFWQEYRAERTLKLLRKLLPQQVATVRDGKVTQLSSEALVPGDIVLLEQGDRVPADCRLIEAFGVRVDDAAITGESSPRLRVSSFADGGDLIHSKNLVLAGASLVSGQARAVVDRIRRCVSLIVSTDPRGSDDIGARPADLAFRIRPARRSRQARRRLRSRCPIPHPPPDRSEWDTETEETQRRVLDRPLALRHSAVVRCHAWRASSMDGDATSVRRINRCESIKPS